MLGKSDTKPHCAGKSRDSVKAMASSPSSKGRRESRKTHGLSLTLHAFKEFTIARSENRSEIST